MFVYLSVVFCFGDFKSTQLTYRKNIKWKIESTISYVALFPEEFLHGLFWPISVSYDES